MPEMHLDDFINQYPQLELKANTVRKWLKLWDDKPQNGMLSESQQALIMAYVENVSSGSMSQAEFVERVKQQQLQADAEQYQADQFATAAAFVEAERNVRSNDGFALGQEFARDFMASIDAGFAAALPRLWNDRMSNEKSPYRLANALIHQKLNELRAGDAKRLGRQLQQVPFAVDPQALIGAAEDD